MFVCYFLVFKQLLGYDIIRNMKLLLCDIF